jgi:hypothetical protein
VFPLLRDASGGVDYLLSDEAIEKDLAEVQEVSEGGSVPNLLVKNLGTGRVLFLEGEELVGAKQNRILNTTVLVAAGSTITIPVSCVEQGRWRYSSKQFSPGKRHSPAKLRRALKTSVSNSLKAGRGYGSDQHQVWEEVACYQAACSAESPTGAMADSFKAMEEKIEKARRELKYAKGAIGFAVAIGKEIVCLELFDKSSTCQKVWDRALSGFTLDAITAPASDGAAQTGDVEQLVASAKSAPWTRVDAVGEGDEYRAEFGRQHASALCLDNEIIHASIVA